MWYLPVYATEVPLSVLADPHTRPAPADVARLRQIHLGMIDAVLAGGGIAPVADIAAEHLHGTVAIVLPAADIATAAPTSERLPALERYVAERLKGRPVKVPAGVVAEVEVRSGDEPLGRSAGGGRGAWRGTAGGRRRRIAPLASPTAASRARPPATTRARCSSSPPSRRSPP